MPPPPAGTSSETTSAELSVRSRRRYDRLNHLLSLNVDRAWRRKAIAALEWTRVPTGTYVDLCAGTLDVAAELSRTPGFGGRVVGADFAEPMLRAGSGKASASDGMAGRRRRARPAAPRP